VRHKGTLLNRGRSEPTFDPHFLILVTGFGVVWVPLCYTLFSVLLGLPPWAVLAPGLVLLSAMRRPPVRSMSVK